MYLFLFLEKYLLEKNTGLASIKKVFMIGQKVKSM